MSQSQYDFKQNQGSEKFEKHSCFDSFLYQKLMNALVESSGLCNDFYKKIGFDPVLYGQPPTSKNLELASDPF